MIILKKENFIKLSSHLGSWEVKCFCNRYECVYTVIDQRIIDAFELLRSQCGNRKLHVTSGFRCLEHNKEIDGARYSKHLIGHAIDILVPENVILDDFALLARKFFDVVITYRDKNFIHCAIDIKQGEFYGKQEI